MQRWWTWVIAMVAVAGSPVLLGLDGCGGGSGLVNIDQSTEIRIGQQGAADIERQYGVVYDQVQTPRVQRIGRSIAAVSQRPGLPWTFKVLNVSDVNAISLPGGPIYITRGLLALGVPDAELAGVLGHEVAHVNDRDAVHAIERAMTYNLLASLVIGGNQQALRTAADLAVQFAVQLPKSRQDEYQADAIGTRLAYNAGYSPGGLVAFLQRLQQISGPDRTPGFLRTHPLTGDRIARAQQVVTQVAGQPRPVPVALSEEDMKTLKSLAETETPPAQETETSPAPTDVPTGE